MIGYEITEQNYELIRDVIGSILRSEIDNQIYNYYQTEFLGIEIYKERSLPIDKTEIAFINVSLDAGEFSNEHTAFDRGTYRYYVDVFTKAKSSATNNGDTLSTVNMHRILGLCRAILRNPIYKTLGFDPGFIERVKIQGFEVLALKGEGDAINAKVGRLTVEVRAGESISLPDGNVIESALTRVKLGETEFGYRYEFIS